MSWVSVLEMAHALNSTQIFHQLISVVSEEKDMEHFSIQDSKEVNSSTLLSYIFISEWSRSYNATASSKLAWQNSWHLAAPPLVSPRNDVWESKRAQKFHTDDATVPRSWKCKFSANQNYFPDLGSVASSVWNLCARFESQTLFRGDTRGGVAKCRLFCRAIGKSNSFFLCTHYNLKIPSERNYK